MSQTEMLSPRLESPVSVPTSDPRPALIHRGLDFWLLGGASIVAWFILKIADPLRGSDYTIDNHLGNLPATFAVLSVFVNYPHFMISYKFAYERGPGFIKKHWASLILVPLALVVLLSLVYFLVSIPVNPESEIVQNVNAVFSALGLSYRVGQLQTVGKEIFGWMVVGMYFSVGWHYSKQIFGCLMVYSRFDQYPISSRARFFLKGNLFSLWALTFLRAQTTFAGVPALSGELFGFLNPVIGFPPFLYYGFSAVAVVMLGLAIYEVIWKNWERGGKLPSLNFLVPWVAFHLWWAPLFVQNEFLIYAVPFFHSLQYLAFSCRIESKTTYPKAKGFADFIVAGKILLLFGVGLAVFEVVPGMIDRGSVLPSTQKVWFALAAASLFINLHHYFIDSVIWRLGDPELRRRLLGN